jgi:hypothetical protein
MKALLTAAYGLASGSSFSTRIGGRLHKRRVPLDKVGIFPYCVFSTGTTVPQDTFTEKLDDTVLRFDILSASENTEIDDIYEDLIALYDDCTLTLGVGTVISLQRINTLEFTESMVVRDSTVEVQHCAVEYSVIVERR